MTGIFDQIRSACREVAQNAQAIHISGDRIADYADGLPLDRVITPDIDPDRHYLGHGDDTVAFFLVLNAVNFGSGYFPYLKKRPGMSGYFTVASSLNDQFCERGPWPPSDLAELTAETCADVLDQDLAIDPVCELMGLFATALNDLGRFVLEDHGGSYAAVVESADASAEALVSSLRQMPFFNDVEQYGDLNVAFLKRAQITCSDLAVAFGHQGAGRFTDLDSLTIFADNLVPHVLRIDGVLRFDEDLVERINQEDLIAVGSPEEIEIRACALHAVERIVTHLRGRGQAVTSSQVDHYLWGRGQGPEYKSHPRHRCRCVYY